ncbi:MAG: hypothetical protein RIC55_11805 [Pirellulaceae bacterium]
MHEGLRVYRFALLLSLIVFSLCGCALPKYARQSLPAEPIEYEPKIAADWVTDFDDDSTYFEETRKFRRKRDGLRPWTRGSTGQRASLSRAIGLQYSFRY